MRARHVIIAFIGLGLLASLACSRNANQQNFIGADCAVEADCPPELLCVNKQCWAPCNPDGTCPNTGETCILNACVPGGVAGGQDGGGGQDSSTGPQDTDGGGTVGNKGDGILARANLPQEGDLTGGFDVDDTCVSWIVKVPDGFGNNSLEVHAASLATATAPAQKLVTVAPTSGSIEGTACANGYAYWIERAQAASTGTLYRRKIDGTETAELIVTTGDAMAMGGPIGHVDDDVFVVGDAKSLRRYDSKTGALDITSYGTATSGSLASRVGTTLFWLYDAGSPPATPWQVWSAQVGSAGAPTGVVLPNAGGGPGYLAFGASGANVFLALDITPKGSLTRVDTTATPNGNPQQVYSASLQGGFPSTPPVAFSGAFGFVNDYSQGGTTAQVMRVNMLDGSKMQIGTSIAPGGARPLKVSATTVYWLEPSTDGQSSNLMKKPKP